MRSIVKKINVELSKITYWVIHTTDLSSIFHNLFILYFELEARGIDGYLVSIKENRAALIVKFLDWLMGWDEIYWGKAYDIKTGMLVRSGQPDVIVRPRQGRS